MRIFNKNTLFGAALGLALAMPGNAVALDAAKMLEGNAKAPNLFELVFGLFDQGKDEDGVELLQYAADGGNPAAQWKLARLHEVGGKGLPRDDLAAFKMYQKIATRHQFARPNTAEWQFVADAMVKIANYLEDGIAGTLVFADPVRSHMMLTTAAMVYRHPQAQFELGRKQLRNENVFGQTRRGVRNLQLAVEKGHLGAEALLGYAHFEGVHVEHDVVKGLVMLGKARRKAGPRDLEWIEPLHDEAFTLARPADRTAAIERLGGTVATGTNEGPIILGNQDQLASQ